MALRSSGEAESKRSASPCDTIWCPDGPKDTCDNNSSTSRKRTAEPLILYSFTPSRWTSRETATSSKSTPNLRSSLLKTTVATARAARGSLSLPFQIKSSPFLPRSDFIDCSPNTQRKASATLLLPEPFGPTTPTIGASKRRVVFLANDLKPESSNLAKRIKLFYHKRKLKRGYCPNL